MNERIWFRLLKDNEVVGYEKHSKSSYQNGSIVPKHTISLYGLDRDITRHKNNFIQHDRKDIFTGVALNEKLLFQRDILEDKLAGLFVIDFTTDGDKIGAFVRKCYPRERIFLSCQELSKNKIVGIEGVGEFKKKKKCYIEGCEREPASEFHSICSYHKNSI